MATTELITELTGNERPHNVTPEVSSLPLHEIGGKHLVGQSQAFLEMIQQVRHVAPLDVGVLLSGERGTGKSLIAEVIHNLSPRSRVPFQQINCAAIPEELIERMAFGSVRGAYTGAENAQGLFEAADGGTLFMDEIGDASAALQAKLLRVIETKTVTRLGSNKAVNCDVRLIFATNRDLSTLRQDFVDRIDEAQIRIPPLRERREDLPSLILYCFERMQVKFPSRGKPYQLDPVAFKVLREYTWPGNIRQLWSVILKIALTCIHGDIILPSDVGQVLRRRLADNPPSGDVLEVEDALVNNPEVLLTAPAYQAGEPLDHYFARVLVTMNDALAATGMSHTDIARTLCIERSTLYSRLKVARALLKRDG